MGVSWMLLPRVAAAAPSAGATLLAIGTSTAPPSPAMVVVVAGAVAETTAGATDAPTHSAAMPTSSATTRTLNFTSSRLVGDCRIRRGRQPHRRRQRRAL